MSTSGIIGLAACGAAFIYVLTAMSVLGLHAARIGKRARTIAQHPTIAALSQLEGEANQLSSAASQMQSLKSRFASLAKSSAELAAALGSLELNIDRVAFATRLVLRMITAGLELRT